MAFYTPYPTSTPVTIYRDPSAPPTRARIQAYIHPSIRPAAPLPAPCFLTLSPYLHDEIQTTEAVWACMGACDYMASRDQERKRGRERVRRAMVVVRYEVGGPG